ncbi:bifunctional protein tyrosine phosphatase family protein/NAD(P)/FAD-dependent oxidoreductase [Propylenella binzhouense]|uniref:TIGR01244 family phosphatase n=1 Tax=Propylenella binzhouense TaxID=2555902 RepID=A0A964T8G4_9HYPH|nr:bifunctional protein tyrosine phosphatase family protein/NAD(P)/FAD-dependent oxidoreductase [Propylenella binzhouense]MYZ49272.1 TIGR01244 family phosphatase [Propylenella binzhouense]
MDYKFLTDDLAVRPQVEPKEMADVASAGFKSIIVNRPDGEGADQPTFEEVRQAAAEKGIEIRYLPVAPGKISDENVKEFGQAMADLPKPVLAFCRTGTRSATLWALSEAGKRPIPDILGRAKTAGYDMGGAVRRIANQGRVPTDMAETSHQIVIVGGGSAGAAVAASLLHRDDSLDIAIIDPSEVHYYQPGWTLVGAGVFKPEATRKNMADVIPAGVKWIREAVVAFEPEANAVILEGCRVVRYERLIVAPGLKLNWDGVAGLTETLGKNGVTSNYRYDLAPYTWELVQRTKSGRALFTQPPMPIKCAGAPQKVMYLSADHWRSQGVLKNIGSEFYNAGPVLFGVKEYVPALMEYVKAYGIGLKFQHNLVRIDGPAKTAWFKKTGGEGEGEIVETKFDMIHVCPPQQAPDFIRVSPLADAAGWVDVDPATLRHKKYENIYALGDVGGMPNAKTAAAARKQAPVVAENLLHDMGKVQKAAAYDGYGSCPLTVERGKIVLAEFGYGGKLLPTFPKWVIDGTQPSRLAWYLKERVLPPVYWQAMLKGREYLAKPERAGG